MVTLPSAYRKFLAQLAPVLLAGVVVIQDAIANATPLGNLGLWTQVVIAAAGAAAVYFAANPWVKLFSSLVAAVGAAVAAALTDNAVTLTEAVQITSMILAWLGVGAIPNQAGEPVRPVGP